MILSSLILLSSLVGFVHSSSFDNGQIPLAVACKTIAPDDVFILDESRPDAYIPAENYNFEVAQQSGKRGIATKRKYIVVHFPPTPYGSTGCELNWVIPPGTQLKPDSDFRQLDVNIISGYSRPFKPTWNDIVPNFEQCIFGSLKVLKGTNNFVNSATCSNGAEKGKLGGGYGLAFAFKFAAWIEQDGTTASLGFKYGSVKQDYTGPFLSYNC